MGLVISVNISAEKGVVKEPIEKGFFKEDYGLIEDAHGGLGHRQVSFLSKESIEKMNKMKNLQIAPGKFAENITTEGIVLYELLVGTRLRVGDAEMEITQIGKECHHGCEIRNIVGDCVMPREGIFAKVLKGGWVKVGDKIEII